MSSMFDGWNFVTRRGFWSIELLSSEESWKTITFCVGNWENDHFLCGKLEKWSLSVWKIGKTITFLRGEMEKLSLSCVENWKNDHFLCAKLEKTITFRVENYNGPRSSRTHIGEKGEFEGKRRIRTTRQ